MPTCGRFSPHLRANMGFLRANYAIIYINVTELNVFA
jgi:hypothetical protein